MIYSIGAKGIKRVDVPENHRKNNLPIGTIIQLEGYDNPRFCIIKNLGIPEGYAAHGTHYQVINIRTGQVATKDTLGWDHISEKANIRGIHMFYTDEVLSAEEIMDLIKKAEQKKVDDIRKKQQADQAKAEERESLLKDYSHLERVEGSKKSNYALGASNIRKELKAAFPGIKFSIRSKGYSMGCSIDIDWQDGPSVDEVRAITNKYEYGTFDSMTDCSGTRSSQFVDLFGGARHVFENRNR